MMLQTNMDIGRIGAFPNFMGNAPFLLINFSCIEV